jgi:hypothetical protein
MIRIGLLYKYIHNPNLINNIFNEIPEKGIKFVTILASKQLA